LPLEIITTIELKKYSNCTSNNTGTIFSVYVPSYMSLLSDIIVISFSSNVILTSNDNFWFVPLLHSVSDMTTQTHNR